MIRGITVQLKEKADTGIDPFGMPVDGAETLIDVDDVLVGEPSTEDVTSVLSLYGKKVAYTLAIPKGDTNDWVNKEVILPEPFAGTYRTVGEPTAGIEANIPLKWNKKVKLERFNEQGED